MVLLLIIFCNLLSVCLIKFDNSFSMFRVVNQSIDEAVSQNLFMSSPSLEKGSPSKRVFRQLSFEDTENFYLDDSRKSNRLKRSKSHNEVASLNEDDSCASTANDDVFLTLQSSYSSRPRLEEMSKTCNVELRYQGEDAINRGLAPQETLSYDSDETHELKRRSERENQVIIFLPPLKNNEFINLIKSFL